MKYLITGISGQLGYDVKRQLELKGEHDIKGTTHSSMDITDLDQVKKVITEYQPDVVFHCAAYTKVDQAEADKDACFNVNVNGTRNVALASKEVGATLINISSDYVYDGEKSGPYEVDDPVNPQNVYGESKVLAEQAVKEVYGENGNYYNVRTSWVFGANGNNFIKTMIRLSQSNPELTVIDDQVGGPTYSWDLAGLLIQMAHSTAYGTYLAANQGVASWADLARYSLAANYINTPVRNITTDQYPQAAKRPKDSTFSFRALYEAGFQPLPHWSNAVDRFLVDVKTMEAQTAGKAYVKTK